MKDRSTIVCVRDGKVLLVARARSRWSLPGGTIKMSETPIDAARRELEEETNLVETGLTYLFQFGGLNKRHHVFAVDLARDASPEPCNEISQCHWFSPIKIATLSTSIPTRAIVDLFVRFENRRKNPSAVVTEADPHVYAD
ncbi:NUDIX hydrolase [Paraburkholderia madseniana]|uniref:NUDIX hydrolase n=1 Tax=Paraburkholderia madseniana TaxID=2599607 RepID=UPI0015C559F2|nr:NUDIX hydrolase [Paraburkholderia madseniana]NPT69390.1 NUDIX domain-containing protein [Paraburkholderia madseniana]